MGQSKALRLVRVRAIIDLAAGVPTVAIGRWHRPPIAS